MLFLLSDCCYFPTPMVVFFNKYGLFEKTLGILCEYRYDSTNY
ncbi:hypothetical protein BARBAKC583_0246 [Bartonella bacilliformis KC583]|uniref:Uncharacterized protein n=1 Tax=Bartonella bacilliformis (strain ATCC 35685 / KC583 / Herrer 020/F12,63) TaxID=360095 RepID=A1URH6_BARBK|nr:hypothetical protein BARBAKC583_0246 [Bartonella bacilliformis KC583]